MHRIAELASGANLSLDLAVLASRSTVSTYADDPLTHLPVRELMRRLAFVLVYRLSDDQLDAAATGESATAADRSLRPQPAVRFSLDQLSRTHDLVEADAPGRVLLDLP